MCVIFLELSAIFFFFFSVRFLFPSRPEEMDNVFSAPVASLTSALNLVPINYLTDRNKRKRENKNNIKKKQTTTF